MGWRPDAQTAGAQRTPLCCAAVFAVMRHIQISASQANNEFLKKSKNGNHSRASRSAHTPAESCYPIKASGTASIDVSGSSLRHRFVTSRASLSQVADLSAFAQGVRCQPALSAADDIQEVRYDVLAMHASDTSEEAAAIHLQAQCELGAARRLIAALQLSDLAHAFALAGMRRRHPDLNERQARAALAKQLYGGHA